MKKALCIPFILCWSVAECSIEVSIVCFGVFWKKLPFYFCAGKSWRGMDLFLLHWISSPVSELQTFPTAPPAGLSSWRSEFQRVRRKIKHQIWCAAGGWQQCYLWRYTNGPNPFREQLIYQIVPRHTNTLSTIWWKQDLLLLQMFG